MLIRLLFRFEWVISYKNVFCLWGGLLLFGFVKINWFQAQSKEIKFKNKLSVIESIP